jgi:aldehyde dehydrogenase (NAD+)
LGKTEEERAKSEDFARIITPGHYTRLKKLYDDTVATGARTEIGGTFRDGERYISPTVMTNVKPDAPIMHEEIFGPILPILTYDSLDQVYGWVSGREKPLSLYIFSEDHARTQEILSRTTAGGTCVNTNVAHLGNPNLPFGGIGPSGIGNYHGHFGFKTFSHERAVLRQGPFDTIRLFYPPYTPKVKKLVDLAIKYLR